MTKNWTKKEINQLCYEIVGCAIEVHRHLGPGLLESVYQECMFDELKFNKISVKPGAPAPINYKGRELNTTLRLDLLVENVVIVELKATEFINPLYQAQLLSYMKLLQKPKGLLINFHSVNISKSVIPLVNNLFAELPD